MGVLSQETLL
jgi:hypothetical protein